MDTNGHPDPASETSRDFHGVLPPNRKIAKERSQHRLAAYLFSTGMSQTEIARKLGVTIATVSQWWRQPWMTQFVKEEIANGSRDVLNEIIKGAAVDSVFTLITLRDEKATPAAVKRQCCSELLDRHMGKAPQTVHNVGYVGDPKDIQRVDAELASMLSDRALMNSLQAPECPEPSLS